MEKAVVGVMFVAVAAVVVGVHLDQQRERNEMHKGVLRDIQRQKQKQLVKEEQQQQQR